MVNAKVKLMKIAQSESENECNSASFANTCTDGEGPVDETRVEADIDEKENRDHTTSGLKTTVALDGDAGNEEHGSSNEKEDTAEEQEGTAEEHETETTDHEPSPPLTKRQRRRMRKKKTELKWKVIRGDEKATKMEQAGAKGAKGAETSEESLVEKATEEMNKNSMQMDVMEFGEAEVW